MSFPTIVVEVACIAPQSDWHELRCLLCSFLRHYARSPVRPALLFAPGRCIPLTPWDFAETAVLPIVALLQRAVRAMRVCDMCDFYPTNAEEQEKKSALLPGSSYAAGIDEISFVPILYTLHSGNDADDPSCEVPVRRGCDDEGAGPALCNILPLPHESLDGLWESLYYGDSIMDSARFKTDLVEYVHTALTFSLAGVDQHTIVWNRLVLLHGPPGTGKTSLCKAFAQKLAIRLGCLFPHGTKLVEVNAHSLFSRWFSESGKQVMQLFRHICQLASDTRGLVCVLIDEVESLAAARQSAMRGNEPSDAIRVVNTLLTQMDRLTRFNNVLVLATSNLTSAIDEAFLDRADKKIYVGPPGLEARRAMLYGGVIELIRKGLIRVNQDYYCQSNNLNDDISICTLGFSPHYHEETLLPRCAVDFIARIADSCVDFNGRLLRKLPFLAYGACISSAQEFRADCTSTLSLSFTKTRGDAQRLLPPTATFLCGNGVPGVGHGWPGSLHPKATETASEEERNEKRAAGGGLAAGTPGTFPALPLSLYLDLLWKVARRVPSDNASG